MKVLLTVVLLSLATAAAVVSDAPAGVGIHDDPCPTVAGEHTNTCPPGTVGMPYSIQFKEAEGSGCGPGKQTFTVDSGVFPPGLSLATSGVVTGTPTEAGSFTFYIKIAEPLGEEGCQGSVGEKRFTIPVNPGAGSLPTLAIGPETAGPATVGVTYSLPLTANLSDSKTWSISEGTLPSGLTLGSSDGLISGTPMTAGSFTFTVKAVIDAQRTDTQPLTIAVREPLVLTDPEGSTTGTNGLAPSEVGVLFSAPFIATGGFGTYTWAIAAGALPPGLALAPDGTIGGRPATAGRYGFTLSVTDAEGRTATYSGLVRVAARLEITTLVVRRVRVGRMYSQNLKTLGGVAPKTWKVKKGRLPRGIRLNSVLGVFTGRPQQAGTYRVTVEVTDALGVKSTRTLTLVVLR